MNRSGCCTDASPLLVMLEVSHLRMSLATHSCRAIINILSVQTLLGTKFWGPASATTRRDDSLDRPELCGPPLPGCWEGAADSRLGTVAGGPGIGRHHHSGVQGEKLAHRLQRRIKYVEPPKRGPRAIYRTMDLVAAFALVPEVVVWVGF